MDRSPPDGLLCLRPRGVGRIVDIPFILLWCLFWLAGELFVISLLAGGAYALLTGTPFFSGDETPLKPVPALATGGFMTIWLMGWTLGGYFSITHFLRTLVGKDCLSLEQGNLVHTAHLGPFTRTRSWPKRTLRRVLLEPRGRNASVLKIQIGTRIEPLTTLGSEEERQTAAQRLRFLLGLPGEDALACDAELPEEWTRLRTPEGDDALVQHIEVRRKAGVFAGVVAIPLWSGMLALFIGSIDDINLLGLLAVLTPIALGTTWQAVWMLNGRMEWRFGEKALIHQRRMGKKITRRTEMRQLELSGSIDDDGDWSYELNAVKAGAPANGSEGRVLLHRDLGEITATLSLGKWLSARTGLPLIDATRGRAVNR